MEWRPAGLSVCLPLLSSIAPQRPEEEGLEEDFFSGTGSPGWSRKKKAVKWLCVCVLMLRTINTAIKKALRQLITFQSLMKALHSETDTTV